MRWWKPEPDQPERLDWWRPLVAVSRRAELEQVRSPVNVGEFTLGGTGRPRSSTGGVGLRAPTHEPGGAGRQRRPYLSTSSGTGQDGPSVGSTRSTYGRRCGGRRLPTVVECATTTRSPIRRMATTCTSRVTFASSHRRARGHPRTLEGDLACAPRVERVVYEAPPFQQAVIIGLDIEPAECRCASSRRCEWVGVDLGVDVGSVHDRARGASSAGSPAEVVVVDEGSRTCTCPAPVVVVARLAQVEALIVVLGLGGDVEHFVGGGVEDLGIGVDEPADQPRARDPVGLGRARVTHFRCVPCRSLGHRSPRGAAGPAVLVEAVEHGRGDLENRVVVEDQGQAPADRVEAGRCRARRSGRRPGRPRAPAGPGPTAPGRRARSGAGSSRSCSRRRGATGRRRACRTASRRRARRPDPRRTRTRRRDRRTGAAATRTRPGRRGSPAGSPTSPDRLLSPRSDRAPAARPRAGPRPVPARRSGRAPRSRAAPAAADPSGRAASVRRASFASAISARYSSTTAADSRSRSAGCCCFEPGWARHVHASPPASITSSASQSNASTVAGSAGSATSPSTSCTAPSRRSLRHTAIRGVDGSRGIR